MFAQSLKAPSPMLTTPAGRLSAVRLEQPEKALSPIIFTLAGMTIDVTSEQPKKALLPMLFTWYRLDLKRIDVAIFTLLPPVLS